MELPGTEFETVTTSDILDKGRALERELKGDYYKEDLVTGIATAALLYSISASPQEIGATEEQLRLAVLRPRLDPAMVAEVLGRMRDQFWYLVYRDRKYRFQTKPNLNKMLRDFELSIGEDEIEAELASHLGAMSGRHRTEFRVVVLPENGLAVMDRAEPVLVFVPWEAGDEWAWMEEILRHHGEMPRVHRNALAFVAPERALISEAKARKLPGLKALKGSSDFKILEPEEQREVEKRLREQQDMLQQTIRRAYTRIFRPHPPETALEIPVRRRESFLAETVAEYVREVLEAEEQLLEKLDPRYLLEKVLPAPLGGLLATAGVAAAHRGRGPPGGHHRGWKRRPFRRGQKGLLHRNLYPLRELLGQLQGLEGKFTLEVEVPGGLPEEKRREIEQLLRDYRISFELKEG